MKIFPNGKVDFTIKLRAKDMGLKMALSLQTTMLKNRNTKTPDLDVIWKEVYLSARYFEKMLLDSKYFEIEQNGVEEEEMDDRDA